MQQDERTERIPGHERFRRAHRLRSSLDFQRVRRRGRHTGGALLSLSYARQSDPGPTRVGFSVSKRVGPAVTRNRVKRRLREVMRRLLTSLAPGWDIVVTARPDASNAEYAALDAEVRTLLARARLWSETTGRGTV